jgi:ribosomal protein S18 acetylase RimI-like enzyme
MLRIRKMGEEDFKYAVDLTDTKGWNLIEDDFKFMLNLEPEGCFVLLDDSEKIGIITSISLGRIGWFGNLMVEEKHQRKGAGSFLVRHVINYLCCKGVEIVGLYSYIDAVPFYEKLGFKYDSDFIVLEGKASISSVEANIREVKAEDFQKIVEFDSSCLNASRRKLLEAIFHNRNNLCYLSSENGQLLGYVMAKVYEGMAEVGPLICSPKRSDVAINLVKTVLNRLEGFEVSFCLPEKESAITDFLTKSGISERFHVARMFLKPISLKDCIYIAESLERG